MLCWAPIRGLGPRAISHGAHDMFNCSTCGHQIDDSRAQLPPFCPRCGQPTGAGSSPFDDDDDAPLPPPPPMAPLPPPPSSGRGVPSKTLFGMPGLNFDEPGLAFPSDDDDLPFPSDDDEEVPVAPPVRVAPPAKPPPAPPRPPAATAPPPPAPRAPS
ncbi:MAG: hypothetical protein R6X02_00545, partial [Enhygromyxa sp.]